MGMVVRSNIMALNANRQLGMNNTQVSKSLEKLSSGFKINRAGDDASGLAISEKMKAQIKGLETASANSQDGISLVQTAEGALTEVHSMLNRMVELATKSANGTMQDDVDRDAIQSEVNALLNEVDRIGDSTNFNGINLLDGSLQDGASVDATLGTSKVSYSLNQLDATVVTGTEASVTFADGAAADRSIVVDFSDDDGTVKITLGSKTAETYTADEITQAVRDAAAAYAAGGSANAAAIGKAYSGFTMKADGPITTTAGVALTASASTLTDGTSNGGLTLQIGDSSANYNKMTVSVEDMRSAGLGINGLDVSTSDAASSAIQTIKNAINTVSTNRANMGALQNRLEYTINNLDVSAENLNSANSRIRDTDMAKEMMNYTKMNVLTQAAQAMLAQANQQPQSILQLLQ